MGTKLNENAPAKPAKINARGTRMMPPGTILYGDLVGIKTGNPKRLDRMNQ